MSALRRLQLQERALLASVKAVLSDGMPAESLKQLVEAVADGLDVERVAVWQYDGAARMLQCRDLYRRTSGVHRLVGGQFVHPAAGYLDALEAGLRLSVDHAQADARMAAFFAVYLGPEGPIAALESPLRRDHRFLGVLSCHASGGTREWHADEHQFLDVMVGLIAPLVEAGAGGVWSTERVPRSSEAIQAAMDLLLTRQALGPSPDA